MTMSAPTDEVTVEVTVEEIDDAAGISARTYVRYVPNKDDGPLDASRTMKPRPEPNTRSSR